MLSTEDTSLRLIGIGAATKHARWRTEAMRSHASARLLFIGKGQGRITIAGLTRGFGPNNLIFVPANTMYGIELGPTAYGQMLTVPPAMASDWPANPYHLRLKDVVSQKELAKHFDELERELTSDKVGANRAAHYHLGLMSVFFERQLALQDQAMLHQTNAAERLVQAFTEMIERDYMNEHAVSHYAATLGVTPTHLTRSCRATCGKSALELLNERILFDARVRLRNSDTPVGAIATDLGFTSPAYFTRVFQAKTGMSPSAFRAKGPLQVLN